MKRNISENRSDYSARISCSSCGDGVGVLPSGSAICGRGKSTDSLEYSCRCGNEGSVYFRMKGQTLNATT
jgi:hypothetical protein